MLKQPVRTSISDFIKTTMGSQFVIPVYQRTYTWNPQKETARFMNDLEDLIENRTTNHFLGIIIYLDSKISAMFRQLQIVDGQQRLTTTFIFLLALKRVAEEKKDKFTAGMIDDYFLYNRHAAKEGSLRLKPAVSTDDVYARLVYGSVNDLNRKEKETGVYRNYDYIIRRIREMAKKHELIEILDSLTRLDILEFPLSETDNAQQIFESINSTGAPLTSADLIRNYVLMNHTDEVQERYYEMYWQPLEEYYPESRRLEEFFRFYLAVKTYELLNRRDVYEGFKSYWNTRREDTETKLREINRYCRYYHDIYEGPCENAEVEKALIDFRRSDSVMPAPFLMEMMHLFDEGRINEKTMIAEIRLIDSYLMRRALCGNDSSALSRYFPTLLRTVLNTYSRAKKHDILSITKVNLLTYNRGKTLAMPTDDQLRTHMRELNAYSLMCIRPVLERIEMFGATAAVDTSDLNIEHIMPQNPNKWWVKNSGTKDEDEYTFYANLIGNLTLCAVYDNSKMGNEDFNYKKSILSKTLHIRMNTEILKKKKWTKDDILKRCDELTEQIIRIYPYNGANASREKEHLNVEADRDTLSLNAPTVTARAIRLEDGRIEVLPGSIMKEYGPKEMKKMRKLYLDLDERGYFHSLENGRVQFNQALKFDDLNTAAQFLMHRGGENADAWKQEGSVSENTETAEENKAETPAVKPEETKRRSTAKKQSARTAKKKSAPAKKKAAKKPAPEKPEGEKKPAVKKTEKRVFRAKNKKPAQPEEGE